MYTVPGWRQSPLFDAERRPPAQDVSHEAAVAWVQVLHDDKRRREIGRQRCQNAGQRRQTARRGGQGDNVKGSIGEMRGMRERCSNVILASLHTQTPCPPLRHHDCQAPL